jgi:hypothetical protein
VPPGLGARLSREPIIWFQGLYGKESHFEQWLSAWRLSDFSKDTFVQTAEVLLSGKTGVDLQCDQFCQSLFPLLMVFESFARFSGLSSEMPESFKQPAPDKKQEMYSWLSASLGEIAQSGEGLHLLSTHATLLDGMIRNKKVLRNSPASATELRNLLSYFIPQSGGHATIYQPKLDDELKKLIESNLDPTKIDEAVMKWLLRLRRILSLLTETAGVAKG